MKVERIDHICIAVKDLKKAQETYEKRLGINLDCVYVAEKEKIKVARYYIGDIGLELMEPTSPEGDVGQFIEKQGEGVFLISYRVPNVEEALSDLKAQGYQLIDEKPRHLLGYRYAFISHPKELCGVLTEIIDKGD